VLVRTVSNLKGVIALASANLIVEARILTRCCFENLFYVAALSEAGDKFVNEMKQAEFDSLHARGQFLIQMRFREEDPKRDAKLRAALKKWANETRKSISPKQIAIKGVMKNSYIYYTQLSADAAHPTLTALHRYITKTREPGKTTIDIMLDAAPDPEEIADTLGWACEAVIGVCVGVDEMLGHTALAGRIRKVADEYASLNGSTPLNLR
jgi:hypothetical protein